MSKDIKYFCDECEAEIINDKCLTLIVRARQGYYEWQEVYSGDHTFRLIYHYVLCPNCVGENIVWGTTGEGGRSLSLSDKARTFLYSLGILKVRRV